MPLKTDTVEEPNLNLTPMIDIVFLLIIFFMVGAQFTEQERDMNITLPTVSDVEPLTSRPDPVVVNVRSDGAIVVRGEVVTAADLEAELRRAKENYPDQAVEIRGAANGPYQHVMDVLAICRRVDVKNIGLAYRAQEDDL
jgi:biopolymer transport protein ExbD